MEKLIFDLQNVGITRQGYTILNGVDLQMHADQHLAIIGPNGAGKSFLLQVLSADLVPSSGTVTLLGKTFGKVSLWELRQKIGFVSSRMAFWVEGNTRVLDVVCSGFQGTYGLPEPATEEQRAAALELLEFFEISTLQTHSFETLSDGERRKVLLSRALVRQPELLILDEPCQGLDIPTRERFLEDLDRLAQRIPMVYVTHHLEELPTCITDVIYLKHGSIFNQGPKETLLTSKCLSAAFDYPLHVLKKGERWYVQHD